MKKFVTATKKWNIEVFGDIMKKKRVLVARIKGIQKCLKRYRSKKLIELEKRF